MGTRLNIRGPKLYTQLPYRRAAVHCGILLNFTSGTRACLGKRIRALRVCTRSVIVFCMVS